MTAENAHDESEPLARQGRQHVTADDYSARRDIVVGVDGSAPSIAAALWAADLAERRRISLVLTHVVDIPGYFLTEEAILALEEVEDRLDRAADIVLDDATERVGVRHPELQVHQRALHGPVDLALIDSLEPAGLLVIGASAGAVGSHAERIAAHAHCTVAVCRATDAAVSHDGPVVVGVDGTPLGEAALAEGFALADTYRVSLVAVHNRRTTRGRMIMSVDERAAFENDVARWSRTYPEVEVDTRCTDGDIAEELTALSGTASAVVVGTHGRNLLTASLVGSTSRHLLRHARSTVLVCRPRP